MSGKSCWIFIGGIFVSLSLFAETHNKNEAVVTKARPTVETNEIIQPACRTEFLRNGDSHIRYFFDSKTNKVYFMPDVEMADLSLTRFQGESEKDPSRLDQHGIVKFRLQMTSSSNKSLEILKKKFGANLVNLFPDKTKLIYKEPLPEEGNGEHTFQNPNEKVSVDVSANSIDLLDTMRGGSIQTLSPKIAFDNPCTEDSTKKFANDVSLGDGEKIGVFVAGRDIQVSPYSEETIRKISPLREKFYALDRNDVKGKRKLLEEGLKIYAKDLSKKDKAILKLFGLSPEQATSTLMDSLNERDIKEDNLDVFTNGSPFGGVFAEKLQYPVLYSRLTSISEGDKGRTVSYFMKEGLEEKYDLEAYKKLRFSDEQYRTKIINERNFEQISRDKNGPMTSTRQYIKL